MRSFDRALAIGHQAERAWVDEQQANGLAVVHTCKVTGATERCQSPDAVLMARVEIKSRDLRFTGPEDYPYETAFLTNVAQADEDLTQPLIYVLMSRPTKCWVWVSATDRNDEWSVQTVRDNTRDILVTTLVCPRTHLRSSDTLSEFILSHELLTYIDATTGQDRGAGEAGVGTAGGDPKAPDKAH